MEDYNVYKEIFRLEDKVMRQIISMNDFGAFEIKREFTKEYGGGKNVAYVSSVEVKAMMKALEELYEEKAN
jgi:hypothetical protein